MIFDFCFAGWGWRGGGWPLCWGRPLMPVDIRTYYYGDVSFGDVPRRIPCFLFHIYFYIHRSMDPLLWYKSRSFFRLYMCVDLCTNLSNLVLYRNIYFVFLYFACFLCVCPCWCFLFLFHIHIFISYVLRSFYIFCMFCMFCVCVLVFFFFCVQWAVRLDDVWEGKPRDSLDLALVDVRQKYPSLPIAPFKVW